MNVLRAWSIALIFALGTWSCIAQEASSSWDQLPAAPQIQPQLTLSARNSAPNIVPSEGSGYSLVVNNAPPATGKRSRIIDGKFLLATGLHLGTALLDVELTQSCIASHQCREGNPIMPSSQAGQFAVSLGFVAYGSGVGYWLKKHGSRMWWLPDAAGIAAHSAGAATGFAHQ